MEWELRNLLGGGPNSEIKNAQVLELQMWHLLSEPAESHGIHVGKGTLVYSSISVMYMGCNFFPIIENCYTETDHGFLALSRFPPLSGLPAVHSKSFNVQPLSCHHFRNIFRDKFWLNHSNLKFLLALY